MVFKVSKIKIKDPERMARDFVYAIQQSVKVLRIDEEAKQEDIPDHLKTFLPVERGEHMCNLESILAEMVYNLELLQEVS